MNPQVQVVKVSNGASVGKRPVDALADLFISDSSGVRVGPRAGEPARRAIEELVVRQAGPDEAGPDVAVTAILAGGLPPERRMAWARGAARRLAAPECSSLLVTLSGRRACVQIIGDGAEAVDDPDAGRKLDRLISRSQRVVLILMEGAAAYLASGRQLPEHCVVLATPDAESLVESYRELKVVSGATTGPVPGVFVVDGGTEASAEQAYRRLARVAISHLGCTPTFVGRCLGQEDGTGSGCGAPQTVMDYAEAEQVYGRVRRLMERRGAGSGAEVSVRDEMEPASAELTEAPPEAGGRRTAPPVAGVVKVQPPVRKVFAGWSPASSSELLEAVRNSIEGLVAGARGMLELDEGIGVAERPDAVAVDASGRPVAIMLAEGDDHTTALRQAMEARRWLGEYLRLLARAYPESGLDPQGEAGPAIVLAAEGSAGGLESLCPPGVELTTWTGVAYGQARGLVFRRVLGAMEGAGAGRAASGGDGRTGTRGAAGRADRGAGSAETGAAEAAGDGQTAVAGSGTAPGRRSVFGAAEGGMGEAGNELTGTSPDDDLSADELSVLRTSLEIDELT